MSAPPSQEAVSWVWAWTHTAPPPAPPSLEEKVVTGTLFSREEMGRE